MPDIIEVQPDKDGVYKPVSVVKEKSIQVPDDRINQFLDGVEKGMAVVDRISKIFQGVVDANKQERQTHTVRTKRRQRMEDSVD